MDFNSSMVRFCEDEPFTVKKSVFSFQFQYGAILWSQAKVNAPVGTPFQFQYGAILCAHKKGDDVRWDAFQFQYGAILCWLNYTIDSEITDFNSSMVRFCGYWQFRYWLCFRWFQFQYGAILCVTTHHQSANKQANFNSSMVRFCELKNTNINLGVLDFNSSMVRFCGPSNQKGALC